MSLPPRGEHRTCCSTAPIELQALYEAAHRTARLFGFRYVETPMFEHTELFARTSGETSDVVTKEMYTFEDKGGRSVTLRPESTAPGWCGPTSPTRRICRTRSRRTTWGIGLPTRTAAGGPACASSGSSASR